MSEILLSIIIPAHNEESRLPNSFKTLNNFLMNVDFSFEVLVVENGSTDDTFRTISEAQIQYPYLRLIIEKNRGKGLAIRRGMFEAVGKFRFIADADLSMPIEEIYKFLELSSRGVDVVIGSRSMKNSRVYDEPILRKFTSKIFNFLVNLLVIKGFSDTQCGFKCFSARAAEEIFSRQRINGMAFDVECLFIARKLGFSITEIPINFYSDPDSKVRIVSDSIRMVKDLLLIRANNRAGIYD
jgi:dolichyl-phosphate beta-glucosyltransferase